MDRIDLTKKDTELIKSNGYKLSHNENGYEVYKKLDKLIFIKEIVGLNNITVILGDESVKNYKELK